MTREQVWSLFVGVWIALALAGILLFYVNRNAAFKRTYFPWHAGLVGTLFLVFLVALGWPWELAVVGAPFVAIVTYMNVRTTYFCDACGRTLIQPLGLPRRARRTSCKCGAAIVERGARMSSRAAQQ
jgi:hypothetical protein